MRAATTTKDALRDEVAMRKARVARAAAIGYLDLLSALGILATSAHRNDGNLVREEAASRTP